jgi:hypothetical protein
MASINSLSLRERVRVRGNLGFKCNAAPSSGLHSFAEASARKLATFSPGEKGKAEVYQPTFRSPVCIHF